MKHVWSFAGISPKHSVHCLGGLMSEKRVTPAAVNAQCPRLGSVTLALRSASERENVTVEVGGCFLLQLLVAKTSTKLSCHGYLIQKIQCLFGVFPSSFNSILFGCAKILSFPKIPPPKSASRKKSPSFCVVQKKSARLKEKFVPKLKVLWLPF